jgi:hypothetical protein
MFGNHSKTSTCTVRSFSAVPSTPCSSLPSRESALPSHPLSRGTIATATESGDTLRISLPGRPDPTSRRLGSGQKPWQRRDSEVGSLPPVPLFLPHRDERFPQDLVARCPAKALRKLTSSRCSDRFQCSVTWKGVYPACFWPWPRPRSTKRLASGKPATPEAWI